MADFKDFVNYLTKVENTLATLDGKRVDIFEFKYVSDFAILSAWAKHFRNHYCLDTYIDTLREGTGLSRRDYLLQLKFPDKKQSPGPSIRSGDFTEILVSDYVEFVLNYWVPRTRYSDKTIKNESTKGVDIIGFNKIGIDDNVNDTLITVEAKSKFSRGCSKLKLQEAVEHSAKDPIRKGESLNAIKQKLLFGGKEQEFLKISRFQNQTDRPYKYVSGAVTFIDEKNFKEEIITSCTVEGHPNKENIILIVFKGKDMMSLVHHLYTRAANEA